MVPPPRERFTRQLRRDLRKASKVLRIGTARSVLPDAELLTRKIPRTLTQSTSWTLQCDEDPQGRILGSSETQFEFLLTKRAEYFCLNRSIRSFGLDQNFVQLSREDGYCARTSVVTDADRKEWDSLSMDQLLFYIPHFLSNGFLKSSWEMTAGKTQHVMPPDWHRREAAWRH